jgi:tetratricopeptide (TPR) repeat protein
MTELEPLLKRIEQLTPSFGRASEDLVALTTRGRHGDYKGVLQNARLVLEMLLRSLVTTELKQTPGKAMLDELLGKFRQQTHAGVIPPNILAHMGTVQAWGNLSAHDHSGGLDEVGVRVGLEEAAASLNSLAAVLAWYKERYVTEAAETQSLDSVPSPAPSPSPAGGKRLALVGGGLLALLVVGLGVVALSSGEESSLRARLDAFYAQNGEPVPPQPCQEKEPHALTALLEAAPRFSDKVPEATRVQEATAALEALRARGKPWGAEGSFLVARASLLAGHPDAAALSAALECKDFAAAENLAGRMAALGQDWKESAAHYSRAAELAPRFWKPPFNLGLLLLHEKRVAEAVPLLERAAELAPEVAEIPLYLGHAYAARAAALQAEGRGEAATGDRERAKAAWCRARDRGAVQGKALCGP